MLLSKTKVLSVFVISIFLCTNIISAININDEEAAIEQTMTYSFSFSEPVLKEKELMQYDFSIIDLPGTISTGLEIGAPVIQIKSIRLLLPQGKQLDNLTVSFDNMTPVNAFNFGIDLAEKPLVPYQRPVRIGEKTVYNLEKNDDIYQTDSIYPGMFFNHVNIGFSHGYCILSLDLYPIQYNPKTGELFYCQEMTIDINLQDSEIKNPFFRDNPDDKAWVQNLVSNPDIASSYSSNSFDSTLYDGGLCDPSDNGGLGYDYVIICREALYDITGQEFTWNDFISRKEAEGLEATRVTVEDITATSDYYNSNSLFNDTPALIREFCKDAYQDWGTDYILVAGDQDGTNNVQRRLMAYEDESDVESDVYFTHLDSTFNEDGDNLWGERGDGGFDLYTEIYSGTIPCDDPIDISNWMKKSFFYADALDKDYLENAAFYGGDTGWNCQGDDFIDYSAIKGTDNWLGPDPDNEGPYPSWLGFQYGFETWNANNPGLEYNMSVKWTAEPPNPGGWQGGSESAAIEGLKNAINNDQCTLISAIAHANSGMSMDVYDSTWESDYHNTMPFFLHDYGCHCGDMDAEDDGVLHSMLFHSDTELAFATVYNTGYGWGNLDGTNSSSALQQKSFWDYLFDVVNNSGGTMNWQMGKAQEWARDLMAPTINWDPYYGTWRGIIESCLLFGDPAQVIKPPLSAEHNVGVNNLEVDSHVTPDFQTTVNATIVNNGENDENNIVVSFRVDGIEQDSQTISFMASQSTDSVSFDWTPGQGAYLVTINATITGVQEEFYFDNERSKIVVAGPDIAVSNLNAPEYAGIDIITPISALVKNLGTSSETITVNLISDGEIEDTQTISLNSGENQEVIFDWIPTIEGTYPVGISAEIAGYEPYTDNNEKTNDVNVFTAEGYVLLVDDDDGDSYENYYETALLASSFLYDLWDRENDGSPTMTDMNPYSTVVWFTGDDYGVTISSEDQTNLADYLDDGGRLFMTGQDIGYDINGDAFYSDYLHATYNVDDTNIFSLEGTTGDPIGNGLAIDISSGDGANNQDWPDGISPIEPANTVFTYESSSHSGGIKTDTGVYKNVYFSFGFEAISNQDDRTTIMDRVLTWLAGDFTIPDIWVEPSMFDVTLVMDTISDEILTIGNDADATADLNYVVELPYGWTTQWEHQYGDDGDAQFAQPVGDIDEDGVNEVIIGGYAGNQAHILQYNLTTEVYDEEHVWSEGGGVPSGATILDLDDDDDLELVVSWVYGSSNGVYAYDWDGTTLTTIDTYTDTGFDFAFDVYSCDYDDDSDIEVLIVNDPDSSSGYHVTGLNWNNDLSEFEYDLSWGSGSSTECPMVWSGDPDNDGKTEVIAAAGDYTVYALNYDAGTWTEDIVSSNLAGHPYGISVGDLDGDSIDEIGVGLENTNAYIFDWTGSSYTEVWSANYVGEEDIIEATAIGDADNDGQNEFLVGTDDVHVISYNAGSYSEESTITQTAGQLAGTIIADCDTDGLNEVKSNDILTNPGKEWIIEYIPEPEWITINLTNGTILIGGTENLTVTFDATSLQPGFYETTILIYSNDFDENPVEIPVKMTVIADGPVLSYSPDSYDFGNLDEGTTDSTQFDIWNSGTDTMDYNLETPVWIDVLPASGSCTTETDTIDVTVDTTGLAYGQHTGQVTITSNGGNGFFTVDLYVNPQGYEILDIEQAVYDRGFPIRHAIDGDWAGAQNFTPTLSSLTKSEIYLRKFGTPEFDLTFELRENHPQGTLIDTLFFTPEEVPSSWEWFTLEFTYTPITPGADYFIVCPPAPSGVTTSFGYEWGYAFGDQYPDGAFWFTRDGGGLWRDLPDSYDFSFKTYGLN